MQYVTRKEANNTNLVRTYGSSNFALTDQEKVVAKVKEVYNLPFNTDVEKASKRQKAAYLRDEALEASSGNDVFGLRCLEACFNKEKYDALMDSHPRVAVMEVNERGLNVFEQMYMSDVPFDSFIGAMKLLSCLIDVAKTLPEVSAYVHTERCWDIGTARNLAVESKDKAFYGITLPLVVQQVVYRLLSGYERFVLALNDFNKVPLEELFRRAQIICPKDVGFSVGEITTHGKRYTILHIHRYPKGKETVTNSFVIA